MRCEVGFCLICDKEIASKCSACGAKSWNSEHTEIQVPWSNGSKMQIAVCVDCSKKIFTPDEKVGMTQAHFDAWDKLGATYDKAVVIV